MRTTMFTLFFWLKTIRKDLIMDFKQATIDARSKAISTVREMRTDKSKKGIRWGSKFTKGPESIRELIKSEDGGSAFLQKITYDVYQGREATEILYKPIYKTISDPTLPRAIIENEMGPVQSIFLKQLEGGEAKFGVLAPGTTKTTEIFDYTNAMEYTRQMVKYNETWKVSEISESFGEAYDKLLNDLHLSPIIDADYVTTGGTLATQKAAQNGTDTVAGVAQLIAFDTSVAKTLRNAISVLPNGRILLINSADLFALEDAVAGAMLADRSPGVVKRLLKPENWIVYDGEVITVGGIPYTYDGVTQGEAYFISDKKKNYKEYVKEDLTIDSQDGDLTRLIVEQLVAITSRGVYLTVGGKNGNTKIALA